MKPIVQTRLPTEHGDFDVLAFDSSVEAQPHLVLKTQRVLDGPHLCGSIPNVGQVT